MPQFTRFSHLPFEVRFQIWEIAILDASRRIVYLQQHSTSTPTSILSSTAAPEPPSQTIAYKARSRYPAVLSACSESRAQARAFFTLAFGSPSCPPSTYFSFQHDFLYLSYSFLRSAVEEPSGAFHTDLKSDIRNVKNLMVGGAWEPSSDTPWLPEFMSCISETLVAFKGLETVSLVHSKHEEDDGELVVQNPTCPYECFQWHEQGKKTTCLREKIPEWEFLLHYGDLMHIQKPPGLYKWPIFYFFTVVRDLSESELADTEYEEEQKDKKKDKRGSWSRILKRITKRLKRMV